jgi:hypothetical protein
VHSAKKPMLPLVATRSHSQRPHPDGPTFVDESKKREVPLHIRMCHGHPTNALRGLVRSIVPYSAIYPFGYINRLDVPVHFHSSPGLKTRGFLKKVSVSRRVVLVIEKVIEPAEQKAQELEKR